MRIIVYKVENGVQSISVVPGRRAHLAPILVRGTDRAAVLAEVSEVAAFVAGRQGTQTGFPVE